MAISRLFLAPLMRWAGTLKYPTLFTLVFALFAVTLVVPDPIPFLDEVLLALGALLLANFKQRRTPSNSTAANQKPPIDGQAKRV